jgi:hypothetical protein
MEVEE